MPSTPTPTAAPAAKTYTNWDALAKSGLVPVIINCQAYRPIHLHDASCHTALKFDTATLQRHMDSEHGNAFEIYLRKSDGKPSPLWAELSASGLEAGDFRCGVCDRQLRLHPTSILQHMKPHSGQSKASYREAAGRSSGCVGMLRVTLQKDRPESALEDDDEQRS